MSSQSIFYCECLQFNGSHTKTDLPISAVKLGENCLGIHWTVDFESITFLQRFRLSPNDGFLLLLTPTLSSFLFYCHCMFLHAQVPRGPCSQTCQHFLFISVSVMILEVTSLPGSILNEVCMQISSKQSPFYRSSLFDWFILQDLILWEGLGLFHSIKKSQITNPYI